VPEKILFNEGLITSASQAFVEVRINAINTDNGYITIKRQDITSAEFSGISIGARASKINCIDPDNKISSQLGNIGAWSNNLANNFKPNVHVTWGWKHPYHVNHMSYLLISTKFAIREDGLSTVELNLLECFENVLESVVVRTMEDLKYCNSWTSLGESIFKNKTIVDALKNLFGEKSSFNLEMRKQLSKLGVICEFSNEIKGCGTTLEPNVPTGGKADSILDQHSIRTSMGDSVQKIISELCARQPVPTDTDSKYSYELIEKIPKIENNVITGMTLKWGWIKMPNLEKDKNNTAANEIVLANIGNGADWFSNCKHGGILKLKDLTEGEDEGNGKTKWLISFDLDVSPLNTASQQVENKLSNLRQYTQAQWDMLIQIAVGSNGWESSTVEDLAAESAKSGKDAVGRAGLSYVSGAFAPIANTLRNNPIIAPIADSIGWKELYTDAQMSKAISEFNADLKSEATNVQNHIDNVISRNVFRSKARILGDPTIAGLDTIEDIKGGYRVMETYYETILESSGAMSRFNVLKWLLMKVTHIIDESGYFTDLELMGIPTNKE
jgi:hypothetical protein